MRQIIFLLLLLSLLSCKKEPVKDIDLLRDYDKSLPRVTEKILINNNIVHLVFSETVEIVECFVNKIKIKTPEIGNELYIKLDEDVKPGDDITIYILIRKTNGNTLRASLTLSGVNNNLPGLLINEVSIKGTSASPDRIELLVTEPGDTLGMVVADSKGESYTLPSIIVEKDDILVIYWNSKTTKTKEIRDDERYTYYLNSGVQSTLSGTNGTIVLSECKNGKTMDSLVYSNFTTSLYSNLGTEKAERIYNKLKEEGEWEGDAVDSSQVTTSRVLARLPGAIDTNTLEDWFVTKARSSTFGDINSYMPYED